MQSTTLAGQVSDIATSKPRVNSYLDPQVYEAFAALAVDEARSQSQMGAILIHEALIARGLLPAAKSPEAKKTLNKG